MFFIYGINAIIPKEFTGTRLIGITAGGTCADAIRHIENYCDERSLLLSSVTIEPMGDEETIDAETVADAIALFANDWLPDWAEEERDRYIGCTCDQNVPDYKERPEDFSVLHIDGTYKDGIEFNEPMLLYKKGSPYVVVVYHNPDAISGDQFVEELMRRGQYLSLWEDIMETPLREGETTEDRFEDFSSEFALHSTEVLWDVEEILGYLEAKRDWCDKEAFWFCEFNARQVAKEIREELYGEKENEIFGDEENACEDALSSEAIYDILGLDVDYYQGNYDYQEWARKCVKDFRELNKKYPKDSIWLKGDVRSHIKGEIIDELGSLAVVKDAVIEDEDDGFTSLEEFQDWYKNLYNMVTEDWEDTDEDDDEDDDQQIAKSFKDIERRHYEQYKALYEALAKALSKEKEKFEK